MYINIEAISLQIREDNAAFAEMTPAGKRVVIAKDVLKQLRAGMFKARRGTYFFAPKPKGYRAGNRVDTMIPKLERCEVCAIGAAFVAAALRLDCVKMGQFNIADNKSEISFSSTRMEEYLQATGAFTLTESSALERAFEGWAPHAQFTKDCRSSLQRMRKVFGFIIETGGSLSFPIDRY